MKLSYKFFENKECKYYPCHDLSRINCLFCYCPLYTYSDCGGVFSYTKDVVKDCSYCSLPHKEAGYNYILNFLKHKNESKLFDVEDELMVINIKGLTHIEDGKISAIRHATPANKDCKFMNYVISLVKSEIEYRMTNGSEFDIEFK